jgi:inorganic pyrophosphatase
MCFPNLSSNPWLAYIGQRISVRVDRPLGTRHPQHGYRYPINYGYLPGVMAPDGEELDAYILGVEEPVREYEGICIAIIHRLDDEDDKLVVVPQGMQLADDEIWAAVQFQEQFFRGELLRG